MIWFEGLNEVGDLFQCWLWIGITVFLWKIKRKKVHQNSIDSSTKFEINYARIVNCQSLCSLLRKHLPWNTRVWTLKYTEWEWCAVQYPVFPKHCPKYHGFPPTIRLIYSNIPGAHEYYLLEKQSQQQVRLNHSSAMWFGFKYYFEKKEVEEKRSIFLGEIHRFSSFYIPAVVIVRTLFAKYSKGDAILLWYFDINRDFVCVL